MVPTDRSKGTDFYSRIVSNGFARPSCARPWASQGGVLFGWDRALLLAGTPVSETSGVGPIFITVVTRRYPTLARPSPARLAEQMELVALLNGCAGLIPACVLILG